MCATGAYVRTTYVTLVCDFAVEHHLGMSLCSWRKNTVATLHVIMFWPAKRLRSVNTSIYDNI